MINPIFLDTPLYRCEALESSLGCKVSIKLETANPVRSFKARGAEVVASLLADNGSRALVCASAGNLGQALAWSGRIRDLEVTVVASRFAPAAKLARIRALDARLELVDGDIEMARERAADIARQQRIRLVEDSQDRNLRGRSDNRPRTRRGHDPLRRRPNRSGRRGTRHRSRPRDEVDKTRSRRNLHPTARRTGHDLLLARTPRHHHRLHQHHR